MSNNPFESVDSIDAEYMERWLNNSGEKVITELSPKTLFDIQCLVKHYSDIIVPGVNPIIEFPTDENDSPKASVEENRVFIPTSYLGKGQVDDTIGAMVHELHHIKLSDKESDIWLGCFNFACKAMDSVFIEDSKGGYNSLYDIVMKDHKLTFEDVMAPSPEHPSSMFVRQVCDDLAFLLNAVEDVRIDAKTPPNLKKYLLKLEGRIMEKFKPKYDSGELDENELYNIIFRFLFHHKGYIEDDYIEDKFGDTDLILNSTPSEYTPEVFKAFKEPIRQHIESVFKKQKLSSSFERGMDVMDIYLSDKTAGDKAAELRKGNKAGNVYNFDGIEFEDREFNSNVPISDSVGKGIAKDFDSKPIILTPQLRAEIESFSKIKIHHTRENFVGAAEPVDFSCVLFDATN